MSRIRTLPLAVTLIVGALIFVAVIVRMKYIYQINNIRPTQSDFTNATGNLLTEGNFIHEIIGNGQGLVTLEAYFPSVDSPERKIHNY